MLALRKELLSLAPMQRQYEGTKMNKKKSTSENTRTPNTHGYSISFAAQTLQVKNALIAAGSKGLTTLDLQRKHGVVHPPARILNLRQEGFSILTRMEKVKNSFGRMHRVGRYFLVAQPQEANQKVGG